jgi:hypothetical protein
MNRRQFLKTSAAAMCIVTMPLGLISEPEVHASHIKVLQTIRYEKDNVVNVFTVCKDLRTDEYISSLSRLGKGVDEIRSYRY